ncbi:MAG: histone deacetylase [Candidatus Eremiobacteraeota bacterium]|nr:histone deacetylase [Candidatus Eremiobacteraeota bacterium]
MLLVYDEIYGDHLRGIPHPESPDRVQVVAEFLRRRGAFENSVAARDARDDEILAVHSPRYLENVKREVGRLGASAGYLSTGDTAVDACSLGVARRAAGGAIAAMEATVERREASFAIVRPPGHHAESSRGMGFCVFNNAVIAARAYRETCGGRVLIADFDYHHGNGTQQLSGNGISYLSSHAAPAYPGTGSVRENRFDGTDAVINVTLPPHAFGTEPFVALWERILPLVADRVKPDLLIMSAGFDYVAGDPIGDLGVDVGAARALAACANAVAQKWCAGRIVYLLEGGYDVDALARSVGLVFDVHGRDESATSGASTGAVPEKQREMLDGVREMLR